MTSNTFDRKITIRDPTLLQAINDSPRKRFNAKQSNLATQQLLHKCLTKETIMSELKTWDSCYVLTMAYDFIPKFKCPMCNGTGANLYLPNTKCDCMIHDRDGEAYVCHDGLMSIMAKKWIPVEEVIDNVSATAVDGETAVKYHTKRHGWYMETEIFDTLDSAKAMCEKYNELEIPANESEYY
jgi:hypothetical protein